MLDRTLLQDLGLAAVSGVFFIAILYTVFRPPPPRAQTQALPPVIGTLTQQTGEVRRRFDGMLVWDSIVQGDAVHDGDGIYVPEGSAATVGLAQGGMLAIDDKSLMVIRPSDHDKPDAPLDIDILSGGAAGSVNAGSVALHAAGAAVQIDPGGQAQVRLRANRSVSVTVAAGQAALTLNDGQAVPVGPQERRTVQNNGAVVGPRQALGATLLTPAAAARVFITSAHQPITFIWEAHVKDSYALQISSNADFDTLTVAQTVTHGPAQVTGLTAGTYYWRVVSRDGGAETVSEERQLVIVDEVAPALLQPNSGATLDVVQTQGLNVAWVDVPGVHHYQVELRQTGQADKTVVPVFRAAVLLDAGMVKFVDGDYCVRVRVDEPERRAAPWSDSTCFHVVVRGILKAPKLYAPQLSPKTPRRHHPHGALPAVQPLRERWGRLFWWLLGGTAQAAEPTTLPEIVLRWEKIAGAVAYRIEIAADAQFANVLLSTQVDDNALPWVAPSAQTYYWRVRAVDSQLREGEVSDARALNLSALQTAAPAYAAAPPEPVDLPHPITWESGGISLDWRGAHGAVEIEVARDRHFRKRVGSYRAARAPLGFNPRAAGVYYWRLRGHEPATDWSVTSSFRLKVAAPHLLPVAPFGNSVDLSWNPVLGATSYIADLARADGGENPNDTNMYSFKTNDAQVHIKDLRPGAYRWSARALDAEGNTSDPAVAQTFQVSRGGAFQMAQAAPMPPHVSSRASLWVGVQLGVYSNLAQLVALRPGLELNVRGHVLQQSMGLRLSANYYTATMALTQSGVRAVAQIHAVPIDLLAVYYQTLTGLTLNASAGARYVINQAAVAVNNKPSSRAVAGGWGAVVALGAEESWGVGSFFADLSWAWTGSQSVGQVVTDSGGLALALGYRAPIL